jgi:hypothetical protein
MRFSEIITEYNHPEEVFWYNVFTQEKVIVPKDLTHVGLFLSKPEMLDFNIKELAYNPELDLKTRTVFMLSPAERQKYNVNQLDGNGSIIKFVADFGWVRGVIVGKELHLETTRRRMLWYAARQIFNQNPKLDKLTYDITIDGSLKSKSLTGEDLENFLKRGYVSYKHIQEDESNDRPLTQQDLDMLEVKLDELYAKLGIDIEFTKHFFDRVNDPRNKKQITIQELYKLFLEEFKVYGKKIAQAGPDFEAVMNDISTALNVPFVLHWNNQTEKLELVSKTIMRKEPFMTNEPKLVVGQTSKRI